MLYPDFDDLISYKQRKLDKMQLARRKVSATAPGNHHSPFRGQGLDFDAVREYVPGDDIRNIDWRVTARTGAPHLKIFKEEKERHTIICVDVNSTMRFGTRNTFKSIQAARCASLLGWRALAHQDRISACFFGDVPEGLHYFESKRTRQALCRILKTLTEPPAEHHHVSIETALQHISRVAHPGSLIYMISDFMDLPSAFSKDFGLNLDSAVQDDKAMQDFDSESLLIRGDHSQKVKAPRIKGGSGSKDCVDLSSSTPEYRLNRLYKNCDVVFISINDAADQALVPAGVIGFCGKNTEKLYLNTDSPKGREIYSAQWESNRQTLHALTERFKIPLISLSTESAIHRDLLLGLKSIAKGKKCLL